MDDDVTLSQLLGDPGERLKVASDDRVKENAGFFLGVPRRDVDNVGLHDHRPGLAAGSWGGMECGDGAVVREAVVPAYDAEAHDVLLVVKDLKPLRAGGRGETRDHPDLPEGPHLAITVDDVAALKEVLVGLRVIEAADH